MTTFPHFKTSVNPQVSRLVEPSSVGVAPHHEDLGVAGVVDPPVVSLEEEVGLLTSAGRDLIVEIIMDSKQ